MNESVGDEVTTFISIMGPLLLPASYHITLHTPLIHRMRPPLEPIAEITYFACPPIDDISIVIDVAETFEKVYALNAHRFREFGKLTRSLREARRAAGFP